METFPLLKFWTSSNCPIVLLRLREHLAMQCFLHPEECRSFVLGSIETFILYFPDYRLVVGHGHYDIYRKDKFFFKVSIVNSTSSGELGMLPF